MVSADSAANARVGPLEIAGHRTMAATVEAERLAGENQTREASPLTLVPYYAWNNRGVGSTAVWLPDNEATLRRDAPGGGATSAGSAKQRPSTGSTRTP